MYVSKYVCTFGRSGVDEDDDNDSIFEYFIYSLLYCNYNFYLHILMLFAVNTCLSFAVV